MIKPYEFSEEIERARASLNRCDLKFLCLFLISGRLQTILFFRTKTLVLEDSWLLQNQLSEGVVEIKEHNHEKEETIGTMRKCEEELVDYEIM